MTDSVCKKVARTLSEYGMVAPGDLVVAGVSGGPDSVCLLDCLHRLAGNFRLSVIVAHFDHGLRPAEDSFETAFVRHVAEALGLPFATNYTLPEIRPGASREEQARLARYRFLEEVKHRYGATRIAVGHTKDDQAETVLMRLLRGSGTAGLAAIPPMRGETVIRPLINVTRKEVLDYLNSRGLDAVQDSSNTGNLYLRNRIRHELMPLLTGYQPRLVERLARTAEILRKDDDCLASIAASWIETHGTEEEDSCWIPVCRWRKLHPALRIRVLRRLIDRESSLRRISERHLTAISRLAEGEKPQGRINLPGALLAERSYNRLHITRHTKGQVPFRHELKGPGKFSFPETGWEVRIEECTLPAIFSGNPFDAWFDMNLLSFPLVLRCMKPGDRFVPLGMTGSRKVKDFFIDLKVPAEKRASTPLLASGEHILWVCGFRQDNRFKVNDTTKRILRVSLSRFCADERSEG